MPRNYQAIRTFRAATITRPSIFKILKAETGYTLLETLVAMALFVSVVIPLGVMIGNFIIDDSAGKLTLALHAAESAMSRVSVNQTFADGIEKQADGMIVERNVEDSGNMKNVQITVYSQRNPKKRLLTLNKTFLVYR